MGYWTTKSLPFTAYNPMVRIFRHAVALDERRAKFRTNLWSSTDKTLPGRDDSGLSDYQKVVKSFVEEKSNGLPPTDVDEVTCQSMTLDLVLTVSRSGFLVAIAKSAVEPVSRISTCLILKYMLRYVDSAQRNQAELSTHIAEMDDPAVL